MNRFHRTFKGHELFKRISKLSPVATELYGFLVEKCDWRLGRYVATSAEMAVLLGVSERSIQRANKELEDEDLVRAKRGIYAVNPEFSWGGRSWNLPKSTYYTMNNKTAQVINFADAAQALNEEALEKVGRETLREITARKSKGNKTC